MGLFRIMLRAVFSPPRRIHPAHRDTPVRSDEPVSHYKPVHSEKPVHHFNTLRHETPVSTDASVQPAEPARPARPVLKGRCYVVDGDTIVIKDCRIRLAGIDAPELDQPYGKNAKWALVKLCKGHVIEAVFDGSLSHERDVATCYLPDGRDLSAEMVKLGMALDWNKFSGGKYRQLETTDARKRLWRADARQKGRFPPACSS